MDAIAILGPTATGKTEVGIHLAHALDGEIISCDSMQVYRGMDIGTAKPTPEQQRRTRFHLIDIVNPDDQYTAAAYQRDALAAITDIRDRHRVPIIVGGTGLYLRALLAGYSMAPPPDPDLRARLLTEAAERGVSALHQRLTELDSLAAQRISQNDTSRVVRALEVRIATGKPITQQQSRQSPELAARRFGLTLERAVLYDRIDCRVDEMMTAGWLDEVRTLLAAGYSADLGPMKSLGYRHLAAFLHEQRVGLQETVLSIKQDTRRFAKRQMTWFRRETEVDWFDAELEASQVASQILDALNTGGSR